MQHYWLKKGKVLVGSVPKDMQDVQRLQSLGASEVLSLLESDYELEKQWCSNLRIKYHRMAIEDFGVPGMDTLKKMHEVIDNCVSSGNCIYVHCFAGLGRAGTVAATWLVKEGMPAEEALKTVRELRPGSVQSDVQEQMVFMFEKSLN